MDVKFNSNIGFGAKRISYTQLVNNYRKTNTVVDPQGVINVALVYDHNIEVVDSLPKNVLKAVVKKLQGRGLFVKPEETEAKSVLIDLVCDITDKGEEARKVFNSTAINSYKTKAKAKAKLYA